MLRSSKFHNILANDNFISPIKTYLLIHGRSIFPTLYLRYFLFSFHLFPPCLFPSHHHHQFKRLPHPNINKQRMMKKKDSLAVNRHIAGRYPRSCSFTFRFEAWSFAARMLERNGERTNAMASRLWRRAYVAPQVYTGAGIYPRRLYTVPAYFRLLGRT